MAIEDETIVAGCSSVVTKSFNFRFLRASPRTVIDSIESLS